jgi:hypothetical protein
MAATGRDQFMSQITIHLQAIGDLPGTLARDLKVGDRLMWNYGYVYTIAAIEDASAKFLRVTERAEDGREYTRRLRKDRAVARI